jgi:aminomethyltransferase
LPLSHQDIGDWPFAATPWQFALPKDKEGSFTKSFLGAEALQEPAQFYTYAFAGFDPRKIAAGENTDVLDADGTRIGNVLTCTTDMAIDRHDNRIYSIATTVVNGKPADFAPKGLSCGFVRVKKPLGYGDTVHLAAGKRKIAVEIRKDVRPHRTARRPLDELMQ